MHVLDRDGNWHAVGRALRPCGHAQGDDDGNDEAGKSDHRHGFFRQLHRRYQIRRGRTKRRGRFTPSAINGAARPVPRTTFRPHVVEAASNGAQHAAHNRIGLL